MAICLCQWVFQWDDEPNLYMKSGCFTKHPLKNWLFRVAGRIWFGSCQNTRMLVNHEGSQRFLGSDNHFLTVILDLHLRCLEQVERIHFPKW